MINTGQTCIAPDYVLVHKSVKKEFMNKLVASIKDFYGDEPLNNKEYGSIINDRHFNRLNKIIEDDKENIYYGGKMNPDTRSIEPTLLDLDHDDVSSMKDELFGPILPVIGYDTFDDVKRMIAKHPNPLALYLFAENKELEKRVMNEIAFGGGAVNDTITYIANHNLPFGGVGTSGIGSYHGSKSFETFSHQKSVLKKSSRIETGILFPPFKNKLKLIKKVMK